MKKMNNNGMTSIELILTFSILSLVIVGMFDVVLNYKDKEQQETIVSSVIDYENKLQKTIQDDLIKGHLVSIKLPDNNTDNKLSASFELNNPKIDKKYNTNLIIDLSNNSISYGIEGEEVIYSFPNIDGLTINKEETSIELIGEENAFVKINIAFSYPDFADNEFSFSISAPIGFPLAGE